MTWAGRTINRDYFKQFAYWQLVIKGPIENNFVIYSGDQTVNWSTAKVLSWHDAGNLISKIENKNRR